MGKKLLITLSIFLLILSFFLAGYFIGLSIKDTSGAVIILDPEEKETVKITFGAKVVDSTGAPYSDVIVEMRSAPIYAITDSEGFFYFFDIPFGEHTVSVLDSHQEVIATGKFNFKGNSSFSTVDTVDNEDGSIDFCVSVDVVLLEVVLECVPSSQEINLLGNENTIVTDDGFMVTKNGTESVENGILISSGGVVILPDTSMVYPNGNYITNKNELITDPFDDITVGENVISDDFSVTLASGSKIKNNIITYANGVIYDNNLGEIQISGAIINSDYELILANGITVDAQGNAYDEYGAACDLPSSVEITESGIEYNNVEIRKAGGVIIDGTRVLSVFEAQSSMVYVDATKDLKEISGGDTVETRKDIEAYQDGMKWDKFIDLFEDKEGTQSEVLYPGVRGKYVFELKNLNDFDLDVRIALFEEEHIAGPIPLVYRLRTGNDYLIGGLDEWLTADEMMGISFSLSSSKRQTLILEWMWPGTGNDEIDTQIGTSEDLTHIINVRIYAVQK